MPIEQIKASGYNLDIKNPNKIDDAHRNPEELLAEYKNLMSEVAATRDALKQELIKSLGSASA